MTTSGAKALAPKNLLEEEYLATYLAIANKTRNFAPNPPAFAYDSDLPIGTQRPHLTLCFMAGVGEVSESLGRGMTGSIRRTILLIVTLCIGVPAILGGTVALSFFLKSYSELEEDISHDQLTQVNEILNQDQNSLIEKALDWAHWEESVKFLKTSNRTQMGEWLTSWYTYNNIHLDLLSYRTFENNSVFTAVRNDRNRSIQELSASEAESLESVVSTFIPGKEFGENKSGIFLWNGTPYLFAAVPVLDDNRQQSGHGFLVVARQLGSDFWARISPRLRDNVISRVVSAEDDNSGQQRVNSNELILSEAVPIVNAKEVFLVEVRYPRKVYASLKQGAVIYIISMGAITVLSFTGLILLLSRRVSHPAERLKNFTHEVAASGNYSRRLEVISNDEFGQIAVGINSMLTEVEQTYQSAQLAQNQAELANQAKTSFLSKASHELRTPIFNIQGFLRILRKCQFEEKAKASLENIADSAQSLLHVVNSVLDFTEFSSTKITMRNSELHLEDLIHEVIAGEECLLRPKLKDVQVKVYLDQRIPEYIVSDERRITQITHHILSNGIKFTEQGSVVAKIAATKKAILLEVRDTGIGIECPERLHNLEEFEQLEKTSNRRFDGLGLGLALCRKILKSVGGKLHIQSVLHVGSTVTVEIPAVYDYDEAIPEVFKLVYESPSPYPKEQGTELARNPIV